MRRRCLNCGQEYEGRPDSTLCPACAAKSKSSVIRDRVCRECGRTFPGGPRAWYCPECRAERTRAADRKAKRNGPARKIGSTDLCQICGREYIVASGRQRYCSDCAAAHLKEVDRAQSREWSREHIDIDARRQARHQAAAERPCAVCGKPFRPGVGDPVTCSPECREIYRRQQSADWERSHKDQRNARARKNYAKRKET